MQYDLYCQSSQPKKRHNLLVNQNYLTSVYLEEYQIQLYVFFMDIISFSPVRFEDFYLVSVNYLLQSWNLLFCFWIEHFFKGRKALLEQSFLCLTHQAVQVGAKFLMCMKSQIILIHPHCIPVVTHFKNPFYSFTLTVQKKFLFTNTNKTHGKQAGHFGVDALTFFNFESFRKFVTIRFVALSINY